MLESIVGVNLQESPLTLNALQELSVFSHGVEIQEVCDIGGWIDEKTDEWINERVMFSKFNG